MCFCVFVWGGTEGKHSGCSCVSAYYYHRYALSPIFVICFVCLHASLHGRLSLLRGARARAARMFWASVKVRSYVADFDLLPAVSGIYIIPCPLLCLSLLLSSVIAALPGQMNHKNADKDRLFSSQARAVAFRNINIKNKTIHIITTSILKHDYDNGCKQK